RAGRWPVVGQYVPPVIDLGLPGAAIRRGVSCEPGKQLRHEVVETRLNAQVDVDAAAVEFIHLTQAGVDHRDLRPAGERRKDAASDVLREPCPEADQQIGVL